MSEMLANQYFISERYFEALDEYSKLSNEQKNDPVIKKKIIICATLNNNFEKALCLLRELVMENFHQHNGNRNDSDEYLGIDAINKLEHQIIERKGLEDVKKMQVAILKYFSDQTKALEKFNQLKDSIYMDIINSFLQAQKINQ